MIAVQLSCLKSLCELVPCHCRVGKLLIMGALFKCLDPVLTAAAALSSKSNDCITRNCKKVRLTRVHTDCLQCRVGKLLIMGALLKCLDPVLTAAAALSSKSPFVRPPSGADAAAAAAARRRFAGQSGSDSFAVVAAYKVHNRIEQQFALSIWSTRST